MDRKKAIKLSILPNYGGFNSNTIKIPPQKNVGVAQNHSTINKEEQRRRG